MAPTLIQAGLATAEGAASVAGRAVQVLGGLDIVVHCAGAPLSKPGGMLTLTDGDWS